MDKEEEIPTKLEMEHIVSLAEKHGVKASDGESAVNILIFAQAYTAQESKAKSIGFAEWIAINGWYFNKIKRWSNRNEASDNLILVISATKSTEELYSLYKEQIK